MRTLSEWLRDRGDQELRELLVARPDLVHPVPAHLGALAERAVTHASVARALDRLDHATLRVVEALSVLPQPASRTDVYAAFSATDSGWPDEGIRALRGLALVWGDDDALRLVPTVHALLVQPAGLGPPAAAAFRDMDPPRLRVLLGDLDLRVADGHEAAADALAAHLGKPDVLDDLLTNAGGEARAVLDQLVWGPPVGTVADATREVRLATARSPVERLLARALLAPAGADAVVLPREVALHLRGGALFADADAPPDLDVREPGADQVEWQAAGQAFAAVGAVEDLLEMWSVDPPAVLRAGGLGVRDLRRTARELNLAEKHAALYIEAAHAAGLLVADSGEWVPTKAYDVWRMRPPQQRWTALAEAWVDSARAPGMVGERDERDKPVAALGPVAQRGGASDTRRRTLDVLATLPPGSAASGESVRARLGWLRPRRWTAARERIATWTLTEAEQLGFTGLGALPGYARTMLVGDTTGAARALAPLLPEPVDHVLLQPDLTAVAPGPLTQDLGRELALAADVESTGGATVYRFSQGSVRRALDAGRSAADLLELLERHSRTAVPQPLRYLIEDVARAHGRIRVGSASAYVRCEDPSVLTELLADRRASRLGLRRLADTVLASQTGRQELTERLRSLGYAPMAESADGDVLVTRADARRAQSPDRPPRPAREGPAPDDQLVTAAVRALRAGDRARMASRRRAAANGTGDGTNRDDPGDGMEVPPPSSAIDTVAALRAATEAGQELWIGYLDAQGYGSSRTVEPVRVEGGFLTAFDNTRDALHRFALHRITGVATLDDGSA